MQEDVAKHFLKNYFIKCQMRRGVKSLYLALLVWDYDPKSLTNKKKFPNFDDLDRMGFYGGSIAIGVSATASSSSSIAIGYSAVATSNYIAIGKK